MQNIQYLTQFFAALELFKKYSCTSKASSVNVYTAIQKNVQPLKVTYRLSLKFRYAT